MAMNFSNENDEQELKSFGVIPSGSIVIVSTTVLQANNPHQSDTYVNLAQSGLCQVCIKFTVSEGQYEGVSFHQFLTCPAGQQNISLSKGQEISARIGGAMFKAMLVATKKNPASVNSYADFGNLKFPILVGIQKNPRRGNDGRVFWNNELKKVITPSMPEFNEVRTARELINVDGAIEGEMEHYESESKYRHSSPSQSEPASAFPSQADGMDDIPF